MADKDFDTDSLKRVRSFVLYWGIPIAAIVVAIWLDQPVKTWVWVTGLSWMGTACILNARKCGRTHCYYTGPFFLIMILPVYLHGSGVVPLGDNGWKWLGLAVGLGGYGITAFTERKFGKYS